MVYLTITESGASAMDSEAKKPVVIPVSRADYHSGVYILVSPYSSLRLPDKGIKEGSFILVLHCGKKKKKRLNLIKHEIKPFKTSKTMEFIFYAESTGALNDKIGHKIVADIKEELERMENLTPEEVASMLEETVKETKK